MDDTKDTKDIKETGEAASVLSADEQMIQDGFNALLNDYLKSNHRRKVERITKAFNFANQAHAGVKRRSGEPYIMHPIAVALPLFALRYCMMSWKIPSIRWRISGICSETRSPRSWMA